MTNSTATCWPTLYWVYWPWPTVQPLADPYYIGCIDLDQQYSDLLTHIILAVLTLTNSTATCWPTLYWLYWPWPTVQQLADPHYIGCIDLDQQYSDLLTHTILAVLTLTNSTATCWPTLYWLYWPWPTVQQLADPHYIGCIDLDQQYSRLLTHIILAVLTLTNSTATCWPTLYWLYWPWPTVDICGRLVDIEQHAEATCRCWPLTRTMV